MQLLNGDRNNRILVVDDNEAIHEDFNKILAPEATSTGEVDALAASLFGETRSTGPHIDFQLTHALQGQEAFELARKAAHDGTSFANRMPSPINSQSGTSYTLVLGDANNKSIASIVTIGQTNCRINAR